MSDISNSSKLNALSKYYCELGVHVSRKAIGQPLPFVAFNFNIGGQNEYKLTYIRQIMHLSKTQDLQAKVIIGGKLSH